VQPIKELSSVAGLYAGRGCALIRQLANKAQYKVEATTNLTPDFIFKCSGISILANIADTHRRQSIEVPHLVMFAV